MKVVAQLLNGLKSAGIIQDYAIFGAVAQMRYTEPVATFDTDVLVLLGANPGLDALSRIYGHCKARGYLPQGEAVMVGEWPVQFMPVFSALTNEAVDEAEVGEIEGEPVRVVGATHLAVIALSVGRAKDHIRILALIEAGAATAAEIGRMADRHGLSKDWTKFQDRFLND